MRKKISRAAAILILRAEREHWAQREQEERERRAMRLQLRDNLLRASYERDFLDPDAIERARGELARGVAIH